METIVAEWGAVTYAAVFLTVLAEYVGIPVPSSMVLILSGALAARGQLNLGAVFTMAFAAATLGDSLWFVVGRMRGEIFIKGYCKLSLGSRDCVRRTKELFLRFPRTSLLLGKFVPGLSTFVVPVAGFSGTRYGEFFKYDTGGILLWAASMIAIGFGFGDWIQRHAADAAGAKWLVFAALIVLLIGFYAVKLWRINKFGRAAMGEAQ